MKKTLLIAVALKAFLLLVSHTTLAGGHKGHNHGHKHSHNHGHDHYQTSAVEGLMIAKPWIKTTPPGMQNTAVYLSFKNTGEKDLVLLKADSSIAQRTEIHQHIMSDGLMKMVKMDSLVLPAKSTTTLEPGGYHIMILGVKQPVEKGDTIAVVLTFESGETLTIQAKAHSKKSSKHHHHH